MTSSKAVVNSVSEIIAAFQLFDKNQDGKITRSEVTELIKTLGIVESDQFQNLLNGVSQYLDQKESINCAQFMRSQKGQINF